MTRSPRDALASGLVLALLAYAAARWHGDRIALERYRGQLDVVDGLFAPPKSE